MSNLAVEQYIYIFPLLHVNGLLPIRGSHRGRAHNLSNDLPARRHSAACTAGPSCVLGHSDGSTEVANRQPAAYLTSSEARPWPVR